jgi:acyl carrier protein
MSQKRTQNVEGRARLEVSRVLKIDPALLKAETNLISELHVDSLDALEIGVRLQDEFGIDLDENDLRRFVTFGEIVSSIENALKIEELMGDGPAGESLGAEPLGTVA